MATRAWQQLLIGLLGGVGAIALQPNTGAQSNIVPDPTVGTTVIQNFFGFPIEAIRGGAERGQNLFHSFQEFNISPDRAAFFLIPNGTIQNVFARVTGRNLSQIDGILATRLDGSFAASNANLFLMNPNGIIFGPGAQLDVGGSFVATTANAIQFGESGLFSASQPASSNLLSINPSAFLFNAIANRAGIESRANLRVPDGYSLSLLGGTVTLDGGGLFAPGGRVELGGVALSGTVGLVQIGNTLHLNFPENLLRTNIYLNNQSGIDTIADNSGDIVIYSHHFTMSNRSGIGTGIVSDSGSPDSRSGDIVIDATGAVTIANDSFVVNAVEIGSAGNIRILGQSIELINGSTIGSFSVGQGNAGNVTIRATDTLSIYGRGANADASTILSSVASLSGFSGNGNGGDIQLQARSILLNDGAQTGTNNFFAQGRAGNIHIEAAEFLFITNGAEIQTRTTGTGSAGDLTISTGTLEVADGSELNASTFSAGNAGNVVINARDRITFTGRSGAFSNVFPGARGDGGDVRITTGILEVANESGLGTSTLGEGNAGTIIVDARDRVTFTATSAAFSTVESGARGNGGDVRITTGTLEVANKSGFSASTSGEGNAGNVVIDARDRVLFTDGLVFSEVGTGARGHGGDIRIVSGIVEVANGTGLIAGTSGEGNAGNVVIDARDRVTFTRSLAASSVFPGARGNGGDIRIAAGTLEVANGTQLNTSTFGAGNAGNVMIGVRDRVTFTEASVASSVEPGARGNGGNVRVVTGTLEVANGSSLNASTNGAGNAGNVVIDTRDRVTFTGGSAASSVFADAKGHGGDVRITAGIVEVANRGFLIASTLGEGNAGNVVIGARDRVTFTNGFALSTVEPGARGDGGDVRIATGTLEVVNGSGLSAETSGTGNAGNVLIDARDRVTFTGTNANGQPPNGAFSSVETGAKGNGGDVRITTGILEVANGAQLSARTRGAGNAGNVVINASKTVELDNGTIATTADQSSGGVIRITAREIRLFGDSDITTAVFRGAGGGGDIILTANSILAFDDSDILAFARDGRGGNVTLNTRAFFGQNYRPAPFGTDPATLDGNDRVDINASGTVSGVITLPDVSFIQNSLAQLTQVPIDTNALMANSCIVRRDRPTGSFFITGTGGLPERPGSPSSPAFPTGEIQNVATASKTGTGTNSSTASVSHPLPRAWKIGDPIVEPQGVYQLPNGELVLSHECSN
jgi:filamentous hemagglutinin family protein